MAIIAERFRRANEAEFDFVPLISPHGTLEGEGCNLQQDRP
jgi:hypothetical protein